jgi:hypothetical protein
MSSPMNNPDGRATLVRSYRNLSEREIRTRLGGALSDAERVTAQAELLRRGAGDDAPDTAFVTGFAPTSAIDIGAVESEVASEAPAGADGVGIDVASPPRRAWPVMVLLSAAIAGGVAWALHAGLIRH